MSTGLTRLQEERRSWRKDHPSGFWAKPSKDSQGNLNLMKWTIGIPGKKNTIWEGGLYPVTLTFPQNYPLNPPVCQFPRGFYHPNVYPVDGRICLSLIAWEYRPSLTLRDIALGIQTLLNEPNPDSSLHASIAFYYNKKLYEKNVRYQAQKYRE